MRLGQVRGGGNPTPPAEAPADLGAMRSPYAVVGIIWKGEGRWIGHLNNGRQVPLPDLSEPVRPRPR
jgi:hypothetical protein